MNNIFNDAKIVKYNGKEVKSITTANGGVIWEKEEPSTNYLTFDFSGTSFNGLRELVFDDELVVDWGDGSTTTITTSLFEISHTYSDNLTEHTIVVRGTVTSLGTSCFYDCNGLTDITISSSITSLGQNCFKNCNGLTDIIIPSSITSLENSCFYGCTGLTDIIIPSSITSLGNSCFNGCTGLTSINIPNSVTKIGVGCFIGCTNLTDYQLYWEDSEILPITKLLNNTNTVFTIPTGQTSEYVAQRYPSDKLVERSI